MNAGYTILTKSFLLTQVFSILYILERNLENTYCIITV